MSWNAIHEHLALGVGRLNIGGVPDGYEAWVAARAAQMNGAKGLVFLARNDAHMAVIERSLAFFAPDLAVVAFPAWDCLPYDRVSPHASLMAQRMDALARLLQPATGPRILLTTIQAAMQRVPPRSAVGQTSFILRAGGRCDREALAAFLERNGFNRASTVMEPGEYALRGGIIDLFPPGLSEPVRLDLFGDELEKIRRFDPLTQMSKADLAELALRPATEYMLDEESIHRFRSGYREMFGVPKSDDPLYAAVSEGRKHIGMEHWLPLFHERMDSLFDYMPDAAVMLDNLADAGREERWAAIRDYYEARQSGQSGPGESYKPLPPERLYMPDAEWDKRMQECVLIALAPFVGEGVTLDGRPGRDFAPERGQGSNVYNAFRDFVAHAPGRILLTSYSEGSADRLALVLKDHGVDHIVRVDNAAQIEGLARGSVAHAVLPIDHGFACDAFFLVTEQDLLGDRLIRPRRQSRRADNFLSQATQISVGDLVVHVDHGVARYEGLRTLDVGGAPHDCLTLIYADEAKLYLPVENIEMLSRFGGEDMDAALDRLGGVAWQNRKARLKKRLKDMAADLIATASRRALAKVEALVLPDGPYQEFANRFPYEETDDQLRAINEVLDDMASGRPMDRLVCGDVGFGKTEVALRAAYMAVSVGKQVALICPTTLLARQHYRTFLRRFDGMGYRIEQLSRLVTGKKADEIKRDLRAGKVDVLIGTHALLSGDIGFADLGLLIVDEEQHFGVKHKEKLKSLKEGVHVLTLTATPIPRTLQLALSGVREMSLISTPPVDRLAVRTTITPFDPVIIREALLRELYRGGQSFFVCPRIQDLPEIEKYLRDNVPEVKVGIAHGQMPAGQLEDVMSAFYDRKYDVLLSTNIVESGLDIPSANTLIIHRADRFGLAQLYQLRGRVGRSKLRGYAYLTYSASKPLMGNAEKRLKILSALDTLGAGFQLASHDLDLRGGGNLLGEEQSGHIREVGFELYQQMLEEAILEAKAQTQGQAASDDRWSPQINLGASVLIPESYVPDLNIRMQLYRRLGDLGARDEIEAFAVEMIDRFGPMPEEFRQLLDVMALKLLCRQAGVEKIEAGPKGLTLGFRNNLFANPAGLVQFIAGEGGRAKLRPDHKLVLMRDWPRSEDRMRGARYILEKLVALSQTQAA